MLSVVLRGQSLFQSGVADGRALGRGYRGFLPLFWARAALLTPAPRRAEQAARQHRVMALLSLTVPCDMSDAQSASPLQLRSLVTFIAS